MNNAIAEQETLLKSAAIEIKKTEIMSKLELQNEKDYSFISDLTKSSLKAVIIWEKKSSTEGEADEVIPELPDVKLSFSKDLDEAALLEIYELFKRNRKKIDELRESIKKSMMK